MNKYFLSCLISIISLGYISAEPLLPKVEILGKHYYMYEAKKGDSLYGVAISNGWDQKKIKELNPHLKSPFTKGDIIYYPVDENERVSDSSTTIHHKITKGETVYGIAKKYGVSPEIIYKNNPGSEYEIKSGDTLVINMGYEPSINSDKVIHKIKEGETLYSLAQRYNTRVEDIMRDNPGVSELNFKAGSEVKISPNTRLNKMIKETVVEKILLGIDTYKVEKNDTWEKISQKYDVDISTLKNVNKNVGTLEKGLEIVIPITSDRKVEKMIPETDPREKSPEGRMEIYEEVVQEVQQQKQQEHVKAVIVLAEPETNKDMEFLRGFLTAVNELKKSDIKISLKVINGKDSEDEIIALLNSFEPDIIFSTADKNFPEYLQKYSLSNICYLVNVFDTKNEGYKTNQMEIQLLTPSEYFNKSIAEYLNEALGTDSKFIIAGETEANDSLLENIFKYLNPEDTETISISELKDYDTSDIRKLIIYGTPTKKQDVKNLLDEVESLKIKAPFIEILTLGRPSWITLMGDLNSNFEEGNVMIPTRFYFDSNEFENREFINEYNYLFGHTPMKSYPVCGASGYDTAIYFLKGMFTSGGNLANLNSSFKNKFLQNDIELRQNSGEGFYNPIIYILKYNNFGDIKKITLK